MLFACIITSILAIALPSLRISPLLLIRIATIALLYTVAISIFVIYIQSIGSGIGIFSGLFHDFLSAQYCAEEEISSSLLLSSSVLVKPNRLTKLEKQQFTIPENLKEILIGLLLGDLNIERPSLNWNARLRFVQGLVHEDYIFHLYELFSSYCRSVPKTTSRLPDKRTGKIYASIYFYSYALPCINEFFDLFYVNGEKIVPLNIGELLTPLGLAYLISDDGSFQKSHSMVILCTESFSFEEVTLLAGVLNAGIYDSAHLIFHGP